MLGVRVAFEEPDQLLRDASPEDVFGRQHGETFAEVEAHLIPKFGENSCASPITFCKSCCHDLFDNFKILHLRVSRVHLHQFSWNQVRPLTEELLVAEEAVVESDAVLGLRVSLRDEKRLEFVFKRWHEDICFVISVDPSGDDQLAQVAHLI